MNLGEPSADPRIIAAEIYEFALVGAGAAVLIWQAQTARQVAPPAALPAWRARWAEFFLWLWLVLVALVLASTLAGQIAPMKPGALETQDSAAMQALLVRLVCVQGAVLAVQGCLLWRGGRVSPAPVNRGRLGPWTIVGAGLLAWLSAYPLLWLTISFWEGVIAVLRHWLPYLETPIQDPVKLLTEAGSPLARAVLVGFAVVVAPVNEELFFRAGIYRFWKSRAPARSALVGSSLVFALMHGNILSFLPLFLLGMLLARAYERSGHIAVSMLFHALFNLNSVAIMLLAPSLVNSLNSGS